MNISLRKSRMLSAIVIFALLAALLPQTARAAANERTTTYHRLDTGVSFLWKHSNGTWQKGWALGSTQVYGTVHSLPANAKNVRIYGYDGNNFDFNRPDVCLWNPTAHATDRESYNTNYNNHSARPLAVSGADSYVPASGRISVTYTATFAADRAIDVKSELAQGRKDYIHGLLGAPTQEIVEAMKLLDPASESYSEGVEGYLWFLPIVFQYDLTEEVPDDAFAVALDLPKSAQAGETYVAKDVSEIGGDLTVKNAELKKRVKGKSAVWSPVVTWPGKGKGQNTGGKQNEKANEPCEIEYELTVETTNGKRGTDTKTIKILAPDEEEPPEEEEAAPALDIGLTAKLGLPETVYEGHSVIAQDQSDYAVDGKLYSADAAYNNFRATHEFRPSAGANAAMVTNYEGVYTDAQITWPTVGEYEVTLRIALKGISDTDKKPIEVLRTPAIVDVLGGRQKENRKQTLTANIATNPKYPLKSAWMEVTDKASGEVVRLYPGKGLENSEHIKTRAIETKDGSDEYFTKLEFPFLTKWNETREFGYTIYAEDTRGQTDTVTKDFTVVHDQPPIPEILLPTTFLREAGTNTARLEATDLSHSAESDPGDQLARTWYVSWPGPGAPSGFADARTLAGYEELSFEEGKEIAFDKTGVGPVSVKIFLKDIWTDETLDEYVTDEDYLTAASEVYETVVDNIAPVVTLSPKATKTADLLLLATTDAEYDNLIKKKNEIDAALIEKGTDARIAIRKLSNPPYGTYSDFQMTRGKLDGSAYAMFGLDGDTLYALTGTFDLSSDRYIFTAPYHLTAYDAYSENMRWSIQLPDALSKAIGTRAANQNIENINATIGYDDAGKYLYFIITSSTYTASAGYTTANETFLFDRKTGAFVKRFDTCLGKYNYISGNSIYSLRADGVYRYRTTGAPERVFSGEISGESALVSGKARFFAQIAPYAYAADFDPVTERTTLIRLAGVTRNAKNTCVAADNTGALFVRTSDESTFFDKAGRKVYGAYMASGAVPIRNGEGRITHAAIANNGKTQSLTVYGLYTGKVLSKDTQSSSDYVFSNVLYGFDYDERGLLDIQLGKYSNDLGSGWGDSYYHTGGVAGICDVNMNAGTIRFNSHGTRLAYDNGRAEFKFESEALYAVGWDLNSYALRPDSNDKHIKVTSIPRSEDQILAQTVSSLLTDEVKDTKTVILVEDGGDRFKTSGAKFKAATGNAAVVKLSGSDSATLAGAIVQSVSDVGLTARKTTVIKKAADAATGSITRTFTLDPQKTYYYEYEANTEDKKAEPLLISTESASTLGDKDNLYVQDTFFEDFSGGALTGFFDINPAAIVDGRLGNGSMSFTFTVPKGAYGVLSFDYDAYSAGATGDYASVSLDGATLVAIRQGESSLSGAKGHYVHKTPVGEGTHTVNLAVRSYYGGRYGSHMILDNLKFETLAATPPAPKAWSVKAEDAGSGWTRFAGDFNTPNAVLSYAAQDLWTYSGPFAASPFFTGLEEYTQQPYANQPWKVFYFANAHFNIPADLFAVENTLTVARSGYYGVGYMPSANAKYRGTVGYPLPQLPSMGAVTVYGNPGDNDGEDGKPMYGTHTVRYTSATSHIRNGAYFLDASGTKLYGEDELYAGTRFTFSSASDTQKIRNLSIWYLENGVKTYVMRDSLESASEAAMWTGENASFAVVDEKPEGAEKEKGALIYKKGQLVAYDIGYADYENDPSKESFWRYTHTPFNDGAHPDAAVVMSRTGETLQVFDKVLSASIDRFQIDGKYVVEHWQRDDTDRTNAGNEAVNYADFNKYSNTETLTFYIEGGGEAPWVTGVRTNPDPVTEGSEYKLEIGVDDLEKDDLTVLVEVYREGKEVYRYYEEDVKADASGRYPNVVTGFAPEAEIGDYTVVVTVWDEDGTGLGSHEFTVLLEGRIEGMVRHTDQWEQNRRSYNTKLFGDAYNQVSDFEAYKSQAAPRKRGTNVFWSGEKFMLEAAVHGSPTKVTCVISGYPAYTADMTDTGKKNADGDAIYEGSIWNGDMVFKWGRDAPIELDFVFTAHYENDVTKTDEARVIVDDRDAYWRLHRVY
ncbi:MAG: hypothetical protein LBD95_01540 [Clostridiales Family XIII bacterium]|jgi:hypothetical protein|nr:hypothetical protein [Clostridiales Family XIII bacterium]